MNGGLINRDLWPVWRFSHFLSKDIFFHQKNGSNNNKITLAEGGKVLTDDAKISETFNSLFGNFVNTLNDEKDKSIFSDTRDENDPLLRNIKNIANILAF